MTAATYITGWITGATRAVLRLKSSLKHLLWACEVHLPRRGWLCRVLVISKHLVWRLSLLLIFEIAWLVVGWKKLCVFFLGCPVRMGERDAFYGAWHQAKRAHACLLGALWDVWRWASLKHSITWLSLNCTVRLDHFHVLLSSLLRGNLSCHTSGLTFDFSWALFSTLCWEHSLAFQARNWVTRFLVLAFWLNGSATLVAFL